MMNKYLIPIVAILICSVSAIETVKRLNFNAYLGSWFEVASSSSVRQEIEKDGFCQLATYTLKNNGCVEVINRQRKGSNQGEFSFMRGYVSQPDVSLPGHLLVDFGYQTKGQYWIYDVGMIVNGQYQWSIVSDPNHQYLWVMARDPIEYARMYEKSVQNSKIIKELGFNQVGREYIPRSYLGCPPYQF